MISKYFRWTFGLFVSIVLFSSCLGSSSNGDFEYSPDAQIYSFSISSKADTTGILSSTSFTIDQVNGLIFNPEMLPYQFHVDSAVISIGSSAGFNKVTVELRPDSSFTWTQSDSIYLDNLHKIITTAQDGENTKEYTFQLNTHQQDPYILSWESIANNYLPSAIENQKTISFNDRFITYYKSAGIIGAATTPANNGSEWTSSDVTGLPDNILFTSLTASEASLYVADSDGRVYSSSNGITWTHLATDYPVVAIFGNLPSPTHGGILSVIEDNGVHKFALTDDFTQLELLNDFPVNIPVSGYTATTVESSTSFAIKYIVVAGGTRIDGSTNSNIWILQEKDGAITHLNTKTPSSISFEGSSLFFYDNKPYLLAVSSGKNNLIYSDNFGLEWKIAEENQKLPEDFILRTNASVITDSDNYIWIFGGVSGTNTQLTDVWRGRLNKFIVN